MGDHSEGFQFPAAPIVRGMHPDDQICLCFHVTQRKIVNYLRRENPPVASLLSECLGAGTGCGWCVPYLKRLHAMHQRGELPHLPLHPEDYAARRRRYRETGERDAGSSSESASTSSPPPSAASSSS